MAPRSPGPTDAAEPAPAGRPPSAANAIVVFAILRAMGRDQFTVQPGGAVAGDLAIKIVGGQDAEVHPATLRGVIGRRPRLVVDRYGPAVAVQPFDDPGAPERFQPPDMAPDIAVEIAAGHADMSGILCDRLVSERHVMRAAVHAIHN